MASIKKRQGSGAPPPPDAPGDPTDPAPPLEELGEEDDAADVEDAPPVTPKDGPPVATMGRVRAADPPPTLARRPTPYEKTQAHIAARQAKERPEPGGSSGSVA